MPVTRSAQFLTAVLPAAGQQILPSLASKAVQEAVQILRRRKGRSQTPDPTTRGTIRRSRGGCTPSHPHCPKTPCHVRTSPKDSRCRPCALSSVSTDCSSSVNPLNAARDHRHGGSVVQVHPRQYAVLCIHSSGFHWALRTCGDGVGVERKDIDFRGAGHNENRQHQRDCRVASHLDMKIDVDKARCVLKQSQLDPPGYFQWMPGDHDASGQRLPLGPWQGPPPGDLADNQDHRLRSVRFLLGVRQLHRPDCAWNASAFQQALPIPRRLPAFLQSGIRSSGPPKPGQHISSITGSIRAMWYCTTQKQASLMFAREVEWNPWGPACSWAHVGSCGVTCQPGFMRPRHEDPRSAGSHVSGLLQASCTFSFQYSISSRDLFKIVLPEAQHTHRHADPEDGALPRPLRLFTGGPGGRQAGAFGMKDGGCAAGHGVLDQVCLLGPGTEPLLSTPTSTSETGAGGCVQPRPGTRCVALRL